jgi:two-component system chemotaxis sensor kinase CheA
MPDNMLDAVELTEELKNDFINETEVYLAKAEQSLMALERSPGDKEEINSVFRTFHTMKGTADYLGFSALKELAHSCEDILDRARSSNIPMENYIICGFIDVVDKLKINMEINLKGSDKASKEPFEEKSNAILREFRAMITGRLSVMTSLQKTEHVPDFSVFENEETPAIRIETYKFNQLMNSINELAILELLIKDIRSADGDALGSDKSFDSHFSRLGKIINAVKYEAFTMKMLPLKYAFRKMNRLIRDLSAKSGKKFRLVISGGETEMDRELVESISEPLMHIIRNSVDHGFETPEERLLNGKPPEGMITLSAACREGCVIVNISDDGRGLNREKIVKKAADAGLIKACQNVDEADIYNLIMRPGFSTADKITDLSGRGVGMDAVNKAISNLNGSIKIKSVAGQGTRVTMILPVTLAIIEGLIVGTSSERFVIPLSMISTIIPAHPYRDDVVQADLAVMLGDLPDISNDKRDIIVIFEKNGRKAGIRVNRIIAQQQITVKNIAGLKLENTFFTGATVLSDGRPAFILAVDEIAEAVLKGKNTFCREKNND